MKTHILNDIAGLFCSSDLCVQEVLSRINAQSFLFQIIIDEQGRVLGTVTDGDIRRGILTGLALTDPVVACMHEQPFVGRLGDDEPNLDKLMRIPHNRPFLPLLDREDRLCAILVGSVSNTHLECALVMAGGLGKRLGHRTQNTPKPLLNVGDRPILEHIISMLEDTGVRRIFISTNYLSEQIKTFVASRDSRAEITLLHESEPLGTAGAVGLLPPDINGPFLVLNGDVLTEVNISGLHDFHERHNYDGTIAVTGHTVEVPFGVIRQSPEGLFMGVDEKPSFTHIVSGGIYCLSPEFINLTPKNSRIDMPDLLNIGRQLGLEIGLFPMHEYWVDVGHPEDLEAAHNSMKAKL